MEDEVIEEPTEKTPKKKSKSPKDKSKKKKAGKEEPLVIESQLGANGSNTGACKPAKERITTPYMTKYEKARILGSRALQLRYFISRLELITRPA